MQIFATMPTTTKLPIVDTDLGADFDDIDGF